MRKPSREPGSTCADALMFSWPPAITISASPHLIACAARWVALRPLPHTLPMVIAGTMSATPGTNRRLARGILSAAGGQHLTHDDLGHLVGLDPGLREQRLDDVRAQIGRGNLGQRPAEFSNSGPQCSYDNNVVHVHAPPVVDGKSDERQRLNPPWS